MAASPVIQPNNDTTKKRTSSSPLPTSHSHEHQTTPQRVTPDQRVFVEHSVFSEKKRTAENQYIPSQCPEAPTKSPHMRHQQKQTLSLQDQLKQQFHFICKIGEGDFSQVYKVRQRGTQNYYALKGLKKRFPRKSEIEDAKKEFLTGLSLSPHPNILQYYQVFTNDWENIYLQTELCESSLQAYLLHNPVNNELPKLLLILHQLLNGLAHIHSHQLMHLDLKPANVLLVTTPSFAIKIADFGLCIRVDSWQPDLEGDKYYMAPELLQEDASLVSTSSDIFSLGIMALEMACDLNLRECPWQSLREGNLPPGLPERVGDRLASMIQNMLNPNPARRPTAQALLHQMEALRTEMRLNDEMVSHDFDIQMTPVHQKYFGENDSRTVPGILGEGYRKVGRKRKSWDGFDETRGKRMKECDSDGGDLDDMVHPKSLLSAFDECDTNKMSIEN